MTEKEIRNRVKRAIKQLFQNEGTLFYVDANERSLTHKLAEYLQREFSDFNVDCEYNRRGTEVKRLPMNGMSCSPDDQDAVTVYPDIIIHKRGIQDNLLVIEVKKSNSGRSNSFDKKKLCYFTSDRDYLYRFGLFLSLDMEKRRIPEDTWFRDGAQINSRRNQEGK